MAGTHNRPWTSTSSKHAARNRHSFSRQPKKYRSGVSIEMDTKIGSDLMYRLLVQGVQDHAIYMLDHEGIVLNWNAGAERAKGYTAAEIVGRNYECFYSTADQALGIPKHNLDLALKNGRYAREGWRYRKDGTAFWASVVIEVIRDEDGMFIGFAKVTRDLSEKRTAELEAEHQASHDALTGVFNRRGFVERLESRLQEIPGHFPTGVLYIDLDHFKPVNDSFGHPVGDEVLREAAGRLTAVIGGNGTVGRLGGDEFAIFTRHLSEHDIAARAAAIVEELRRSIHIGEQMFNIGASVGVAITPHDGTDMASLLRNADLALYRAKFDGRNRVCRYDAAMGQAALARRNLEHRLRQAVRYNEFYLLYQPIVDGEERRTLGYEALIRWTDEAGSPVSPRAFVPLAESIGLMPAIGEWTLRRACEAAATWPDDLFVSVNLSATQFKHPPLANLVIRTLIETGLPARRLKLEITETSVLEDLPTAKRALTRLRDIGVGIALDDFGTGFSSLSLVQELPLTSIKIDRSFISDRNDACHADAFVRSVAALCEGFDLTAIAEGVETEAQRQLLLASGCRVMQGYLFGRPSRVPALDTKPALETKRVTENEAPVRRLRVVSRR